MLENHNPPDDDGGSGGPRNVRADSGLSEMRDARLTERAIRSGWIKSKRWPTGLTLDQFQEKIAGGQATFLDRALITAQKLMNSQSERANGIGVRSIIAMESQNQSDDHRPDIIDGSESSPFGCEVPLDQIAREMAASVPTEPPAESPIVETPDLAPAAESSEAFDASSGAEWSEPTQPAEPTLEDFTMDGFL